MWEKWSIPAILCWTVSSWFLPVPLPEISTEGMALWWCYWHNWECDGTGDKASTKWLPGMFPIPLQSLTEVYGCTRGLFGSKCSLNDCTVMYFSEIKWFQEHFEVTMYYLCSMVMKIIRNIYLPTVFMTCCVTQFLTGSHNSIHDMLCDTVPHRVTQLYSWHAVWHSSSQGHTTVFMTCCVTQFLTGSHNWMPKRSYYVVLFISYCYWQSKFPTFGKKAWSRHKNRILPSQI